jgi:hypothetical protein
VSANASDSNGTVSKVEFLRNGVVIGTVTASPYSWIMSGLAAGSYSLTAKATNNAGAVTTSGAVSINVTAPSPIPTLAPPAITAPTNGAILSGTSATISWSSVPGAASYLVRCQDLSGTTPYDTRNTANVGQFLYIDKYVGTFITLKVVSGHSYRFWIHAVKSTFSYSDSTSYSAPTEVRFSMGTTATAPAPVPPTGTFGAPTITAPTEGAKLSTTSVTVSWNAVPGATSYMVRCSDLTGATPYDSRNTAQVGPFLYIDKYTPTSVTIKVVSGHSYRFWIHAANSTSTSAGSYRSFSVIPTGIG